MAGILLLPGLAAAWTAWQKFGAFTAPDPLRADRKAARVRLPRPSRWRASITAQARLTASAPMPGLAAAWTAWQKFGAFTAPDPVPLTLTGLGALAGSGCRGPRGGAPASRRRRG
jgi:hypothetical protein